MPYVQRNSSGRVTALFSDAPAEDAELLPATHPDVLVFLNSGDGEPAGEGRLLMAGLDSQMIRVLEDLLDVLIEKQVILFTDLPNEARLKILARKETRARLNTLSNLIGDTDEIL